MSEKCSLFARAFVGRSNHFQAETFSQLCDQQTRLLTNYFIKQWRSGKGLRRARNNSGNSMILKSIHLKFMDMWLAKNNEPIT